MDSGAASWTTIAMILFVVVGCILVVFLGYLVRSAYDMRIGLKAQLDRGLRDVQEDSVKKARQLRQELGAEIERARAAIFEESRKRVGEAAAAVESRWLEFEKTGRQERVDTAMSLDALRDELAALRRRIDDLEREMLVGGPMDTPPLTPVTPASAQASSGPGGGGKPEAGSPSSASRGGGFQSLKDEQATKVAAG
jgi:hypothetical protein